jgi:hypothetical protein
MQLWTGLMLLLATSFALQAAEITSEPRQGNPVTISLVGEIKPGDSIALRTHLENAKRGGTTPIVSLSSPGGSYSEGIKIARVLSETGTGTLVRKSSACYSACATAFLGGNSGGRYSNPSRVLEPGGKIGFHAPYLMLPSGSYDQAAVEGAYEVAVRDINEFIRLTKELFVDPANVPDLLVPSRDSFFEVRYAFDATNLGIEIKLSHDFPAVTPSMITNACTNQNTQFQDILRMWRRGAMSVQSLHYNLPRLNQDAPEPPRLYRIGDGIVIVAVPTKWFQGGYYWCFVKAAFVKASTPIISCQGIKWISQTTGKMDVVLSQLATSLKRDDAGLGEDESCLGVGSTSETLAQFLVPPITPIEEIPSVLANYLREPPLKP